MIQASDEQVEKDVIDNLPITNADLFRNGLYFKGISNTNPENCWVYKDVSGYENVLLIRDSLINGYPRKLVCNIPYPQLQYSIGPGSVKSDTRKTYLYTKGQLERFIRLAHRAAKLRMHIAQESKELNEEITGYLWKG